MNYLDIVVGAAMIYGLYKGWKNGLLIEVATLVALVAAVYGAIHFSHFVAAYLSEHFQIGDSYLNISSFLITFIGIVIGVHFLGKLLTKIAKMTMLGWLNRIAGGLFGVLKISIIIGALLLFFEKSLFGLTIISDEVKRESIIYAPVSQIGELAFDFAYKNRNEIGVEIPEGLQETEIPEETED